MSSSSRHLAIPILLRHVADGVTLVYPFPGTQSVELLIEGSIPRLTLSAHVDQAVPPPSNRLKNVAVTVRMVGMERRLTVAITGADLLLDGHAMLCAIADRIQLEGRTPSEAVSETLAQWRSVLAARTRLDVASEIGLMGELLFLEALSALRPKVNALEAWRGGLGEEHDFGLASTDVELKTTSGERREHWINGLGQLEATGTRPLVLVSLQITRGGSAGRTLAMLIDELRQSFAASSDFDDKLTAAGWAGDAADLFVERWHLRSPAKVFIIDNAFPALTTSSLSTMGRDLSPVRDVHYRLDLHDRPPAESVGQELSSTLQRLEAELT